MLEELKNYFLNIIDFNDSQYDTIIKSKADDCGIMTCVSMEISLRKTNSIYQYHCFFDSDDCNNQNILSKVLDFCKETKLSGKKYCYIVTTNKVDPEYLNFCDQYPWTKIIRISKERTDTLLHRAYHSLLTNNRDMEDFLSPTAKQSQVYSDDALYSPFEYFEKQGIPIKKNFHFQSQYLTKEQIQEKVNTFIKQLNIDIKTTNVPLSQVAEILGVKVVYQSLPINDLGYYSVIDNAIFINESLRNDETYREQFTIAHELGHCALHKLLLEKYKMDKTADDDWGTLSEAFIIGDDKTWIEWQANQFASFLLLPEDRILWAFVTAIKNLQYQNKYAENMRKVLKQNYLWCDPNDKLADNKGAAHAILSSMSDDLHVSQEAIKYRLISLNFLRKPESISLINFAQWLN